MRLFLFAVLILVSTCAFGVTYEDDPFKIVLSNNFRLIDVSVSRQIEGMRTAHFSAFDSDGKWAGTSLIIMTLPHRFSILGGCDSGCKATESALDGAIDAQKKTTTDFVLKRKGEYMYDVPNPPSSSGPPMFPALGLGYPKSHLTKDAEWTGVVNSIPVRGHIFVVGISEYIVIFELTSRNEGTSQYFDEVISALQKIQFHSKTDLYGEPAYVSDSSQLPTKIEGCDDKPLPDVCRAVYQKNESEGVIGGEQNQSCASGQSNPQSSPQPAKSNPAQIGPQPKPNVVVQWVGSGVVILASNPTPARFSCSMTLHYTGWGTGQQESGVMPENFPVGANMRSAVVAHMTTDLSNLRSTSNGPEPYNCTQQ